MIPSRRRFLLGASSLLMAPAIVRVASIMPVSVIQTNGLRDWLVSAQLRAAERQINPPIFCVGDITVQNLGPSTLTIEGLATLLPGDVISYRPGSTYSGEGLLARA